MAEETEGAAEGEQGDLGRGGGGRVEAEEKLRERLRIFWRNKENGKR